MLSASDFLLFQAKLLDGIGDRTIERLIPVAEDCSDIFELSQSEPRLKRALSKQPNITEEAEKQIEQVSQKGIKIITRHDCTYPNSLRFCEDAPYFLFVRGNVSALNAKVVGIVGSRRASSRSLEIARKIAEFCSSKQYVVLSGLAEGCDWAAHDATIRSKGKTIAVLPHGLLHRSSNVRETLMSEIVEKDGALVSQFSPMAAPNKGNFVARDKLQAGFSALIILIESALNGGSLHACRAAIAYGRALSFVAPLNSEEISANQILATNDTHSISDMLRCSESACKSIFALESKDDYAQVEDCIAEYYSTTTHT